MTCAYSHIANPDLTASQGATSAAAVPAAVEAAAANSITTDGLFVMAPYPTADEAQRQLRTMGDERSKAQPAGRRRLRGRPARRQHVERGLGECEADASCSLVGSAD